MLLGTITTVVTAAGTYDLTDLDTVRDELSLKANDTTNDNFLSRAISQASVAIANYCNRVFAAETVQDVIYASSARAYGGVAALQLSRYPVIAITSATVTDGTGAQTVLVAGTDYTLDATRGWLVRLSAASGTPTGWYQSITTVTYSAGYATIPDDLVEATLRVVTQRFSGRGRDPLLKSQSQPGLGDQTYWVGSAPGVKGIFTEEICGLIDAYALPLTG